MNAAQSEIRVAYENHTVVPSLAKVRKFNPAKDSDKEFTQIYVSFFHPIEDFKETQPALLMSEVRIAVALGEWNFINKIVSEKEIEDSLAEGWQFSKFENFYIFFGLYCT